MYNGQGLGNQLWCYVTTRLIAKNNGYRFGIKSPEKFKGIHFMDLDFGEQVFGGDGPEGGPPHTLPRTITHYHMERQLIHPDGSDVRMRDDELIHVPDNTKIDGCMQDVEYVEAQREVVREWLQVKPEYDCYDYSSDEICIINFRGSGYVRDKNFFLPKSYWVHAMNHMRKKNPRFRFIVITEDVVTAQKFFPDLEIFHFDIAKDYSIIKNAHYLILSNSSFAQFPALLSTKLKFCIAPKYWARHNISDGYWSLGYSITTGWTYQDREGNLHKSAACASDFARYREQHKDLCHPDHAHKAPDTTTQPVPRMKRNIDIRGKLSLLKKRLYYLRRQVATLPPLEMVLFAMAERRTKKTWISSGKIAEYRKNIKVYDVFTFWNELDLLEIRLNILDPYVDHFVIVEATETFSGEKKPLYFEENRARFKKWEHKILHYVITDTPKNMDDLRGRLHEAVHSDLDRQIIVDTLTSNNVGKDIVHWLKEFYQKESIKKALVGLQDTDICYISDLDEIWNPELEIDYTKDSVFKPLQIPYVYFLNNRSNENWRGWTGTIVTQYKNIKNSCLNHLRTHKKMGTRYVFLKNGGWHFTFQGGFEGALRKLEESNHPFYDPKRTIPTLAERIAKNKDFKGRNLRFRIDERGLPKYLLHNKDRYKKFFK